MNVQSTSRVRRGLWFLVLLMGFVVGSGGPAQAGALIQVCASGCDYADLREAVAKAPDRSTLLIGAGEYAGPVIIAKNIALIGSDRNKVVIARGVIAAGPFQITLRNLTITQGLNGVHAQAVAGLPPQLSPVLTLEAVTIKGNAANGLALLNSSRASLCDVLITKNGVSVSGLPIGSGIALRGSARILVGVGFDGQPCGQTVVRENSANGISAADSSTLTLGANTLITKHGLNGLQMGGSSQATIQGLISRENTCYGVTVEENAKATIVDGQFERNGKAGVHVGGPAGMLPGCVTQGEAAFHATASITGAVVAGNRIGILIGDLSKDFEQATVEITSVTLLTNGCDMVVDPVAKKKVKLIGTLPKPCS